MARWERTVAVVSYTLAQSKASARLAALFFTLLAQASVLQAASPLVPGCVRGSIRYGRIRSTSLRTALANYAH